MQNDSICFVQERKGECKMNITLREVTMKNFKECINLKVKEEQKNFVASNMYSLAEAKADNVSIPLAIYKDETMVGFIMFCYDEKNEKGWIDRLMVDEKYQRNGYGRAAMIEVINRLKEHETCKEISISFVPDNIDAEKLYENLGFRKTGEICHGEVVSILQIK